MAGGEGGEVWQRGKRHDGVTRAEAGQFGCRGGGRCRSVTDGASAGSARQERRGRFEDAGAGPGLLEVAGADGEGGGSSSERRGCGCLIDGQGDGAARFFTCITAGSAFTKPVQQLGQSRGGRSSTGTSGPASLRTFIIRIHAGTVVKATVKLSPCRRSSAHICDSL